MVVYAIWFNDNFDSYIDMELGLFRTRQDALATCEKAAKAYVHAWSENSFARDNVKMETLENGYRVTDGEEDYSTDILVQEIEVQ